MTVSELINELKKFPQHYPVFMSNNPNSYNQVMQTYEDIVISQAVVISNKKKDGSDD